MKKKITTILLLVLVLLTVLPVVTAAAPYSTYTYTQDGTILLSPDAYVPDVLVDVNYMELKAYLGEHSDIANTFDFEGDYDVRDIFVGPDQKVYIVDGDHGAVLVLDRYYKVERVLNSFINEYGDRKQDARPFILKAMTQYEEQIAAPGEKIVGDWIEKEFEK